MNTVQVLDASGCVLVDTVEWAGTIAERMRGLMVRRALGPNRGMALAPCNSIHTCFMRFSLDVIFFDRDLCISRIVVALSPYRAAWGGLSAWGVLELESGWFPLDRIHVGDQLVFKPLEPVTH